MNKIYRVVWNAELGQWVVASEVAKGRKKKASSSRDALALAITSAALGATGLALTAPAEAGQLCVSSPGGTSAVSVSAQNGTNVMKGCGPNFSWSGYDVAGIEAGGSAIWVDGDSHNLQFRSANGHTMQYLTDGRLVGISAGYNSTDAVNVSQLRAVEAKISNGPGTGNGIDTSAVHYDGSAKDRVTLAGSGGTTLTNLKDGSVASGSRDAVTGNQLFATNQNVTNLANNYNTLSNNYSTLSTTVNNITTGGGIKYFHSNSTQADSAATGAESVAIGPKATAKATNSVAIGNTANAQDGSAIAVGGTSEAKGSWSVALGTNAKTALDNSVALGSNTSVTAGNSVALGANSIADRANTVSVGSVAVGGNAFANADKALAIGANANVSATNAGTGDQRNGGGLPGHRCRLRELQDHRPGQRQHRQRQPGRRQRRSGVQQQRGHRGGIRRRFDCQCQRLPAPCSARS